MTYTFIDREIENGVKNAVMNAEKNTEKKDELNTVYNFIKQGLVSVEQAAKSIGLTKEQLLAGFKEYNLVL